MDTQEYEGLAEQYLDCIYRVAVNGCRNFADAEDIVQNTFVKLWERKETFEDEDYARKWLIRVAVNECNSLWRSAWKRHTSYLEELTEEPVFSTPEKSSLYFAVRDLPLKYRQIVHLYYFEEYSVREIAEVKKIGMSAAKKLAVAAAVAAVLFAGSNGVAYAMTGSTWLETVVVKLNINGAWQEMEMEGEVLEDGTVQYSGTVEVPDETTEFERTEVVEENGNVYLVDGDVKIDITEDVADGTASGTYEKNGVAYQYEVKEEPGVPGCWELHISSEEE